MHYIYTSWWEEPNPAWDGKALYEKQFLMKSETLFECDAEDVIEADKQMAAKLGFKMSDKFIIPAEPEGMWLGVKKDTEHPQQRPVAWITTWSPQWSSNNPSVLV